MSNSSVKGPSESIHDLHPVAKVDGSEPNIRGIPAQIPMPAPNTWPSLFWLMFDFRGHGVMDLNCILREEEEAFTNSLSQVMVSLTELHAGTNRPMLAPASMEVWNVVPRTVNPPARGSVLVRVNIQWHEPIPFRVNMIVLN
jgi:hypothetical protein